MWYKILQIKDVCLVGIHKNESVPNIFSLIHSQKSYSAGLLECYGFHGQTCCLLKPEEQVHGVDSIACATFEKVVDYGGDHKFAIDFVEMDYALVGVDHIF